MKKHLTILTVALFIAGVSAIINSDATGFVKENYSGNGNSLNLSLVQPGDLINMKGVLKYANLIGGLFPGYWHHTAIAETAGSGGTMIEAWDSGVRRLYTSSTLTADEACILRVNTSSTVKTNAKNFAVSQIGKPYDYGWLLLVGVGTKDVNSSKWYCSELAWAAYKRQGIDIDKNPGWTVTYWNNVAPGEIYDDGDTYTVARAQ